MKLHEVLFAPCLSARPLLSCHSSVCSSVAGLVESWVRVSLVRRWSICSGRALLVRLMV